MESSRTTPSLGRRFMLMVILGAVLPLGLLGMWVTRSAARSGRSLLHSQLEAEVSDAARALNQRWQHYRSDLLTLGESNPVRLALLDTASANQDVPAYVQRMFARMPAFDRIEIRDRHGRTRFALESMEQRLTRAGLDAEQRGDTRGVPVRLPITDLVTGDTIGSIDASVRAGVLLPAATELASPSGPLTAIFASGRGVVPAGADEQLFSDDDVEWGGHRWLTVRRSVADPGVEVAVARALDPYVRPFERTARRGTATLLLAAGGIVVMLVILTRRMTAEVERDLAQRDALAAVGEFASELAHEVRNPLTAIRLDLQRVEETADNAQAVRGMTTRILRQIDRLDRSVVGALRVARGGSIRPLAVNLHDILESARRAAEPEFAHRGGRVLTMPESSETLHVQGDAAALEQLFLNLLVNAAQSLALGGEARISAMVVEGSVVVTITDTGAGMTPKELEVIRKPFHSTRRDGTGLGLKIARRIASSHGGELEMQSTVGVGTTVVVRLPGA